MTETEVQVYDFEGKNVRTMVLNEEPYINVVVRVTSKGQKYILKKFNILEK